MATPDPVFDSPAEAVKALTGIDLDALDDFADEVDRRLYPDD